MITFIFHASFLRIVSTHYSPFLNQDLIVYIHQGALNLYHVYEFDAN